MKSVIFCGKSVNLIEQSFGLLVTRLVFFLKSGNIGLKQRIFTLNCLRHQYNIINSLNWAGKIDLDKNLIEIYDDCIIYSENINVRKLPDRYVT